MTATVPSGSSFRHYRPICRHVVSSILLSRRGARGPYHIEDAGREAEHQEYHQPPRRDAEPPVECPADAGTYQDPGHEFNREPKSARKTGGIGARLTSGWFGRAARPLPVELIAETPQPRGESSLIGGAV